MEIFTTYRCAGEKWRKGINAISAAQFAIAILCRTYSAHGYWITSNPVLCTGLLYVGTLYLSDMLWFLQAEMRKFTPVKYLYRN